MITTKNKTGELKGEWIDSGSEEYNAMGLNFPSFINFENILDLPTSLINRNEPIGRYPNIEKLLNIHGINEGS